MRDQANYTHTARTFLFHFKESREESKNSTGGKPEFRTFLPNTGPVALKQLLPDKLYLHFLIIQVAGRICSAPKLKRVHNEYADKLL